MSSLGNTRRRWWPLALAAVVIVSQATTSLGAGRKRGQVRFTRHMQQQPMPTMAEGSGSRAESVTPEMVPDEHVIEHGSAYEEGAYYGDGDVVWQQSPWQEVPWDSCDTCAGECCCPAPRPYFYTGVDFVIAKPHFDDDVSLIRRTTDDVTFETVQQEAFDYDLEFSPRVFLGYVWQSGLGARVRYWTFDHDANSQTATPDASGLETISSPFSLTGGVFVPSTNDPTDTFTAESGIDVDALDVEFTKGVHFDHWALMLAGGIRYARVDQTYQAQVRNANNQLLSDASFTHGFDGVGPTISLQARRPLIFGLQFFTNARIAALFGNGKSQLIANDNPPFATQEDSSRDDLLTVGELAFGLEWSYKWYGYGFFFRGAMEGQTWQGAGTPTSEEDDLGFFGTTFTAGLDF